MKTLTHHRPLLETAVKPWAPFSLENRLRRFLAPEFFPEFLEEPFAGWTPVIDLIDVNGELVLTAELPGMKLEDVDIEVVDNVLSVKGEKKEFEQWKDAHYKVAERHYGMFERSFTLPRAVEVDKIYAEFMNGILTVHLPKTEEAKGRRIKIEAK